MKIKIKIFEERSVKRKSYPIVGETKVYLRHDQNLGKCLLSDGFITPNMPKLLYAIEFRVKNGRLEIIDRLNPKIHKYKNTWVFEKRDGFNLLFYQWKDKIIPKTRTAPIATGRIQQILKLKEFPMKSITRLVKDGFIPIFEVWGSRLDEFDIMHGSVNYAKIEEIEDLPQLSVDVIAIRKHNPPYYTYIQPKRAMKIAKDYSLNFCKFHGMKEIAINLIKELMAIAEEKNKREILCEGFVLHCTNNSNYEMFKVKPLTVMRKDVLKVGQKVPRERIEAEISKILLETELIKIARNPIEYLDELLEYLKEDYRLTKRLKRGIAIVFSEIVARELKKLHPEITPEIAGKQGIHKMIIGALISLSK